MSDPTCARPVADPTTAAVLGIKPGEVELLVLLADGRTLAQIARHYIVTYKTVVRWFGTLRRRTGAQTNAQLVAWAYQRGVLEVFVG